MEKGVASEELKDVCSPGTQKKLECRIFSHFYPHLSDDEDRLRLFFFFCNKHSPVLRFEDCLVVFKQEN